MKYKIIITLSIILSALLSSAKSQNSSKVVKESKNYCKDVEKIYANILKNKNIDLIKTANIVTAIDSSQQLRYQIENCNNEDKFKFCKLYLLNKSNRHEDALNLIESNFFFQNSVIEQQSNKILIQILKSEYFKHRNKKKKSLTDMIINGCADTVSIQKKDTIIIDKTTYNEKAIEFHFKIDSRYKYSFHLDKEIQSFNLDLKDSLRFQFEEMLDLIKFLGLAIDSIEFVGKYDDIRTIKNVKMSKELGQIYDLQCLVNNEIEIIDIPPGNSIKSSKYFVFAILNYFHSEVSPSVSSKIKLFSFSSSKLQIQIYASPK